MSDYMSRSLAAVSSWHRNVYESYDEPEAPECDECGEPLESDADGWYCGPCSEDDDG